MDLASTTISREVASAVGAIAVTPSNVLQVHNAIQAESERLSAKLKEVIVDRDLLNAQHLLPDRREVSFEGVAGRSDAGIATGTRDAWRSNGPVDVLCWSSATAMFQPIQPEIEVERRGCDLRRDVAGEYAIERLKTFGIGHALAQETFLGRLGTLRPRRLR